jgi:hypothetical protein
MDHPNYLGKERTVFSLNDKNVDYVKHYVGFIIYIVLFVIGIPYLLVSYGMWGILSAYFPNLDMIATIIGYHGGPADSFIWTHLYNPSDTTITGYISSNLINYFALLGVMFIIIHFALSSKSMFLTAARAAIMLLITYFIPGNLIVYFMNKFGKYLNRFFISKSIQHYLLVLIAGFIIAFIFIISEAVLIKHFVPNVAKMMEKIYKQLV